MKQSKDKNSPSSELKLDILLEDLNQKLESDDLNLKKLFKKIDKNDMGSCTRKEFIKIIKNVEFTKHKNDLAKIADEFKHINSKD